MVKIIDDCRYICISDSVCVCVCVCVCEREREREKERERAGAGELTVRLQKVKLPCRTCRPDIADGSHLKGNFCLSALVCVRIPSASGVKPDSH